MKIEKQYKINIIVPFVTMADIAFLLLIFLIISSSTQKTPSLKLSLPKSRQFDRIKKTGNVEIFVTPDNKIVYNKKKCDLGELKNILLPGKLCVISADKETDFKMIYQIIELLKENNYENLSFAVKRQTGVFSGK